MKLLATVLLFSSAILAKYEEKSGIRAIDPAITIVSYNIETKINLRYSQTEITAVIRNENRTSARSFTFDSILPNSAFLVDFHVEGDNKIVKGILSEKNNTNSQEVSLWVRNANIVSVDLLLRQLGVAKVLLAFNEVLERKSGYYEQISYLRPELIGLVQSLKVTTDIDETNNVQFVRIPFNQHDATETSLTPNRTIVEWIPTRDGEQNSPCSVAQYGVQFDVLNDDGEVIIIPGFFFLSFVPINMEPLRKHVVFILDISGSMGGIKIEQMKTAMLQILTELKSDDFLNIITFQSTVEHWMSSTQAIEASPSNIAAARTKISSLLAGGGTNANEAFQSTFQLVQRIRNDQSLPQYVETIMFFLTDGEPTDATPEQILTNVQSLNRLLGIPIYSLAFGTGANKDFLQRLALQNTGIFKEIFQDADAADQLENFYNGISSPVLVDVQISYESDDFDLSDLTVTNFTSINQGASIKVTGKLSPKKPGVGPFKLTFIIQGLGRDGPVTITKEVIVGPKNSEYFIEDNVVELLWAHTSIQDYIAEFVATGNVTAIQNAQALALQHGFVIPYTTLMFTQSRCTAGITVDPIPITPLPGTNCSISTNGTQVFTQFRL